MNVFPPIAMFFLGYLLGSVPFGVITSRWLAGIDPRMTGSRNIGFTNVLRTAGRIPALLTLLGDLGKGYIVVRFARELSLQESWVWLAALSAVLGHIFPVFLGFKGGKGVATGLGVLYGIEPLLGWITILTWGLAVWLWRVSSLGAIIAFGLLPLWVIGLDPSSLSILYSILLTTLVLTKHRSNIARLRSGTEPKIGQS